MVLAGIQEARMKRSDIRSGQKVITTKLGDTSDLDDIREEHLRVRREGIEGVVGPPVMNHGTADWLIFHDGSDEIGAYRHSEFELRTE